MTDILGHLHCTDDVATIIDQAICSPCMMSFITRQFLAREPGGRPPSGPARTRNHAFVGRFCELPDDVVFTVDYTICSALVAAYALLGFKRAPPAVYKVPSTRESSTRRSAHCTTCLASDAATPGLRRG
jgi:oleate hydratase